MYKTTYFVVYNCKFMERFFSIRKAVEYVKKKGWKNDRNNDLYIISCDGKIYNAKTGKLKKRV